MQTSAHEPRGSASDSLMLQIDVENVVGVYRRLDEHIRELRTSSHGSDQLKNIPPCGQDPVSLDAVIVFQPKVDSITKTHEDYISEVVEARDRLRKAAQEYGLIEDENTATLQPVAPPYNGPLLER